MTKIRMSAAYNRGIRWIAHNDEPTERLIRNIEDQLTVMVVAIIFNVDVNIVARDILKVRNDESI